MRKSNSIGSVMCLAIFKNKRHINNRTGNNLVVSCDPVAVADTYHFEYSDDNVNWNLLYDGEKNSYTYLPPSHLRYYRVRADNEYGEGEWIDVISCDPSDVPVS